MRTCMTSFTAQKSVTLKIVYNKKKIQIFGMNSPLMKYAFFASLDENKWHIHSKNLNILYILPLKNVP